MALLPNRHDSLITELEGQPLADVSGILSPLGMGGASTGRSDYPWILRFTFLSWQTVGGQIQNHELTIHKRVSDNELKSTMGRFKAYDVIRISARIAEHNSSGKPQALMDQIIGKNADSADLNKRALELQEPVTFNDERFGIFTLDRRIDWYEAVVPWGSAKIRLTLTPFESGDAEACLPTAYALWDSQPIWERLILDYAAAKLLSLKNDNWLGEDESELNSNDFKDRLTLESINVMADGKFEFWFNDGDLFWGHSIRVSGSLSKGPTSAGIEG